MAKAFRKKSSRILGTMSAEEVAVVIDLLRLTREFVAPEYPPTGDPFLDLIAGLDAAGEDAEPAPQSQDPAMRRLLPPAHHTDTEQAAEFRRLTEQSVRSRKTANLAMAIEALEEAEVPRIDLSVAQAEALAVGLTDVRLILGERLGMRTDQDSERLHELLGAAIEGEADVDPALVQQMAYYDFLTWLQDSVTTALLSSR